MNSVFAVMRIDYWSSKALSNPKIKYIIKSCGYKSINAYYRNLENMKTKIKIPSLKKTVVTFLAYFFTVILCNVYYQVKIILNIVL